MINGDRIRTARLAGGLSQRGLADHAGLSTAVVRRLEDGETRILHAVSVASLLTLADTVALTPSALFTAHDSGRDVAAPATDDSDDAPALAAVLWAQVTDAAQRPLCGALGWDLPRLRAARDSLNLMLTRIGLTVRVTGSGWRIVPLDDTHAAARQRLPSANQTEQHGLDTVTARALHSIAVNGATSKTGARGRARLTRLATLESLGAITHRNGQPRPSDALDIALMRADPFAPNR